MGEEGRARGAGPPGWKKRCQGNTSNHWDLGVLCGKGITQPFPSARGRLANGAISRPATYWEQRYRRTVNHRRCRDHGVRGGGDRQFLRGPDAANWHEKWGILAFGTWLLGAGGARVSRSWAPAVLGQGAEEFRRLGRSLFAATVVLALGGIALTSRNIKLWIFVAVPAIALVTMTTRYLLRLGCTSSEDGWCLRTGARRREPGHTVRDLITGPASSRTSAGG
ncbi:hypothetical protein GCM10023238_06320 [Streptomyces heliomycini]